jgi:polar amino acid transport system substrate-binding protein
MKRHCLIFLFLVLSACGKSKGSSGYQIALDPNWYSMELPGKEKNLLAFSTELLKEISSLKKINIDLLMTNWDSLIPGLQQGKYEGVLSTLYPYAFNGELYRFSDLYLATGPVLVVTENSPIHSLEMLQKKEVAVLRNNPAHLIAEKVPDLIIRVYDSIPQMLNDLLKQTIDGALVDTLIAQAYCQDIYHEKLRIATPSLDDEGLRLITLKTAPPALVDAFNQGLKELKANGTYQALLNKWFLG